MTYTPFSLNGTWKMHYAEEKYIGEADPFKTGNTVDLAVPGYWEDMTEKFQCTEFYSSLNYNPMYCRQRYPMTGYAPDMALPTIIGNFFYRRSFFCAKITGKACLHIGGVQNSASVWINGKYLGRHEGYSTPFDFDIPDGTLIEGENIITLSVSNHRLEGFDGQPVSGLTSRAACEGTGGIWGDVELRVYQSPLRDIGVKIANDLSAVSVTVEAVEPCHVKWSVKDGKNIILSGESDGDFSFDAKALLPWSPENPKLYTLTVESGEGSIDRPLGIRRLVPDGVQFKLNGKPYYLRGVCEHCYYPITIHPNRDISFYRDIIKKMKELGFNYIRCHTFVPDDEYMQAADELGMLFHIESPNNTTLEEWRQIVTYCRRHPSVVIYCCGNELQIHDDYIRHLEKIADDVHARTDSLFSPMSALRGFEYAFGNEPDKMDEVVKEPCNHNPRRFAIAAKFCDLYNSYTSAHNSYSSVYGDPKKVDSWSDVYGKPRLSHEIGINGTYTDLSLKDRYKGTPVGNTEYFSSIEKHLKEKGLLENAPLYFRNSCQWQRRVRKHCFENVRLSEKLAGYDFLGPIDTHWHTFGYDVGMMNEFYEMKPGESVRGVLMYNSPTVLLTSLGVKANFECGENVNIDLSASHYGDGDIENATLTARLMEGGRVVERQAFAIERVENGRLSKLAELSITMPESESPKAYKLYVTLEGGQVFAENEWEIYAFPKADEAEKGSVIVSGGMSIDELKQALRLGNDILFLGGAPFPTNSTSFQIALAGRTSGNLATVIHEHELMNDMPHEGFCSWQFRGLMESGRAVCFLDESVPFDPIVEVVSTHKFAVKQASLFEFKAFEGRVLVCTMKFNDNDPAARWLKNRILNYMQSENFDPKITFTEAHIDALANAKMVKVTENTNFAFNPNDKTSRK